MVKNRLAQMIYRSVEALFGLLCALVSVGIISSSGFGAPTMTDPYKYFTNLSNYAVTIYVFFELFFTIKKYHSGEKTGNSVLCPGLKFSLFIAIALTMVVANTMLSSMMGWIWQKKYWGWLTNPFLHLFNPLLFIVDFLLFSETGKMKWSYPLYSLIFPLGFVIVYLIVGAATGADSNPNNTLYPYPFLNVGQLGYGSALLNCLYLVLGFLAIGYLIVWIDKHRAKKHKKEEASV